MTGKPKPCTVCGVRPPAMREIPYCFVCWPGGPVDAPPCYKCRSRTDYFTSGLCARCHPHAPGRKSPVWNLAGPLAHRRVLIDACPDCHAWGVTRTYGWLCVACRSFRETHSTVADCVTCGQQVALYDDGSCRLCHRQRSMAAHDLGRRTGDVSIADAVRHGQQLFLAGMWHQPGTGTRPYVKKTVSADMRLLRPVSHRQLVLFDLPRDLKAGLRNGFPPPPDPGQEAALIAFVGEHATRYGWRPSKIDRVRRAMRIMLGIQDTPGAPIRRSDVALLSRIKHSAAVVADVLADAGLLDDDRQPAIVTWYTTTVAELPPPMRHELDVWFDVMRNGSTRPPRRKPRADATIGTQLRWALPALRHWAAAHPSLREIGVDDVRAVLPTDPLARYTMLQGLRSIFRVLKGQKLVFVNPTGRMSARQPDAPAPRPVNLEMLRADLDSDQPATAALAALLAFHAVRIGQLRELRLTDIRDSRLHVAGQIIPLAPAVQTRVRAWLDHRQQTWPNTPNPHMFIHVRNAITTRPVTIWWIRHQLATAGQRIRTDRILDEAHATGGDIRQLIDLFGLSVHGANRYIATVTTVRSSPTPASR